MTAPSPGGGASADKVQEDADEEDDDEPDRRSIDDISREEVLAALRDIFRKYGGEGVVREELLHNLAAELRFKRLGPRIRERLDGDLLAAVRRGVLCRERGLYYVDCPRIVDYYRKDLQAYLLSVMGGVWWDQDEAVQAAARHLGFRRTGSRIQRAFRSAINGLIRQRRLERDGARIRAIK